MSSLEKKYLAGKADQTTTVFYHDDRDGFGAAWAIWRMMQREGTGEGQLGFLCVDYGATTETITEAMGEPDPAKASRQRVIFVDFCPSALVLWDLIFKYCFDVVVIDHHQSGGTTMRAVTMEMDESIILDEARAAWADAGDPGEVPERFKEKYETEHHGSLHCIYDEHHSAAVLTWLHFNAGETVPLLLRYVEDRDLWHWALPASREVSYYIDQYDRTVLAWDDLAKSLETDRGHQLAQRAGEAIERTIDRYVALVCGDAHDGPAWLDLAGYRAAHINSSVLQSEIGHHLVEVYSARLAAVWCILPDGELLVSLRGDGSINCCTLAESFGGGGHHNAAGFRLRLDETTWSLRFNLSLLDVLAGWKVPAGGAS